MSKTPADTLIARIDERFAVHGKRQAAVDPILLREARAALVQQQEELETFRAKDDVLRCSVCKGTKYRYCICHYVSASLGYGLPTRDDVIQWRAKEEKIVDELERAEAQLREARAQIARMERLWDMAGTESLPRHVAELEAQLHEAEARVQTMREARAMITVAVAHDHAQRATTDAALASAEARVRQLEEDAGVKTLLLAATYEAQARLEQEMRKHAGTFSGAQLHLTEWADTLRALRTGEGRP